LLHDEAVRLKRLSKRAKHQSTRQRAAVLLASNVKMTAPQIAEMWQTDASWVRKVIHAFNEREMASLRPRYRGGRPRQITTDQRQRIVSVAGARPDHQGVALTRWSLPRLSIYLSGSSTSRLAISARCWPLPADRFSARAHGRPAPILTMKRRPRESSRCAPRRRPTGS
jgi:transposase